VWGFGDGSIYEGVTPPKHVYALPGNYSVSMMVKDLSSGCTDTLFREAYIHINGTSASCNTSINVFPSDSVTLCYLEKKWLSVSSDATNPTYQWYRNGMLLGGETNDSLLVEDAGAYSVVVYSNQACPVSSPIIHVRMSYVPSTVPEVASSGSIGDCSSPTNLTLNATNGFTNYQWNNGANTQSITVHEAGLYQVSAQDVFGCVLKSNLIRLNTASIPATDLCMASFDSLANRNRVAWTKNSAWLAATDSFFVYECEKDNSYRLIKKQSKTALATVLSSSSNPYVRSYDYLLASSDTCGNKVFSEFRRNNIFLQVNAGMGVYRQLSWTAYHDTLPFYYKIYRYTIGSVACIDSVPSTKLYYIDQTSNDINAQYKVAVFFDDACAIENGNTYAASFSNPAYNNVVAIPMQVSVQEHVGEKVLWAYPNPTSNRVTIGCSTFVIGYVLTDLFGKEVMHENVSSSKTIEIDLQSLASGMYQLRVLGGTTKTLLLVKH
jgi:PKD repeat protein